MEKHYTYGKAIKNRGKHQIIIVDTKRLYRNNIEDLLRQGLGIKPHNYKLINETEIETQILRLAQYFKKDMAKTLEYYTSKEEEYMKTHYQEITTASPTRDAKQYALNETYHKLVTQENKELKGI